MGSKVASWRWAKGGMIMRALLILAAILGVAIAPAAAQPTKGRFLYVFAGDQKAAGKDFLAVIDADPESPGYGKLLASVATDQVSIRPHHTEYEMPPP